mgnify:CR=1 FL=1
MVLSIVGMALVGEGKEVNISAGRALVMAYSAPATGKANKIYAVEWTMTLANQKTEKGA